jgi:hypothetical protein
MRKFLAEELIGVLAVQGQIVNQDLLNRILHSHIPPLWVRQKCRKSKLDVRFRKGGCLPLALTWGYYSTGIRPAKVGKLTSLWKILTCVNQICPDYCQNKDKI